MPSPRMPSPGVTGFNTQTRTTPGAFLLVISLLVLAGCSSDDFSSSSNQCVDEFGPAASVNETLSSFRVGDGREFPGERRERTLLRTFFRAITPDSNDHSSEAERGRYLAEQAGILSDPFMDFDDNFPASFPGYTSTRNMPDLMEALITSGRIDTFNNARNAMRRCVEKDQGGTYRNSQIRLTEEANDNGEAKEWWLRLSYNNNRRPGGGIAPNISRFIAFTDFGVTFQSLYDPEAFQATGFNSPRETRVLFNSSNPDLLSDSNGNGNGDSNEGTPQLGFFLNRPDGLTLDLDQDLLVWTGRGHSHTLTGPGGQNMDIACLIFRVNYIARKVEVWTQQDSCSVFDDGATLEPLENFTYNMNATVFR